MRKHLKLEARLSEDGKEAFVSVIKQSHRGRKFSESKAEFNYTSYTGIPIQLKSWPTRITAILNPKEYVTRLYPNGILLYVNGISKIDKSVNVPIKPEMWRHIKAAVEAYNSFEFNN